jgi:two-component system cell cycle sensor histidine kinase/response regulator CckA
VYGIVKQSGGWIWVDSTPGQGTTVTIDFPVTKGAVVDPVRAPEILNLAAATSDATILVVDDEEAVLRAVAKQLRRMGYKVLEASGGVVALELASHNDQVIDLLLTDLAMLGMNGPELARRMTELRPETPVLYMSAHPQKHLVSLGWLTSAEALLTKPFTYAELGAAVQQALTNRTIRPLS